MPMTINFCDVGHGSCAGIVCPNGKLIVVDVGYNSDPHWRPSHDIVSDNLSIELLVLTNLDEDHLGDFRAVDLLGVPKFYQTNWSITPEWLKIIKGGEHNFGPGTSAASKILGPSPSGAIHTLQKPELGGIATIGYRNICPHDFLDTNNLSYVFFASYAGHKVIFPGDLEEPGWKKLLEREDFRNELRDVTIFVASHHGRKSGCCDEVFKYIYNPRVVLISDTSKEYDTQETVNWYSERVSGIWHNGQFRKVLTTRNDGHIRISVHETRSMEIMTNKAA